MRFISLTNHRLMKRRKKSNATTLSNLKSKRFGLFTKRHLTNLSSYQPNEEEEFVLSLGLNFSLPPVCVNREGIMTSFEMFYHQVKQHKANDKIKEMSFKANLLSQAHCYGQDFIGDDDFSMCTRDIRKSIKSLKINKDLIITKPDKGSGIVLLDRKEYVEKMLRIISDTTKFEHLGPVDTHDRTAKREKGLQDFLKELCPKDKEGEGKDKNRSSVNKNKYVKGKKIKKKSDNKAKALMQLSEQEYKQVRPIGAERP